MKGADMIDNRQFIITNKDIEYADFIKIKIDYYWLLYQKNIRLTIQNDKDNVTWYLIGQAYCADKRGKTPADDIKESYSCEIRDKYFYWAGKWTLIGNNEVHSDCVGINSEYYYQKAGFWYISPSLHVLISCNTADFEFYSNYLIKNISFDWCPAPLTKVKGVFRTFTSQIITIAREGLLLAPREVLSFKDKALTRNEKNELLCKYLTNVIVNISKYSNRDIWLALTGGGDSRTLLSVLLKEKIEFESFIMDYDLILKGDKKIPFDLANKYGFTHHYITKQKDIDFKKILEFDEHTYSNLNDANRLFYGYSQFDEIPKNVIMLKAAIFEIGKAFYFNVLTNPKNVHLDIYKVFPDIVNFENYKESLDLWFQWIEKYPNEMDPRDRLYMEQRNGGWIANLEQSLELLDQESIQPANCAAIVSLLSSLSYEDKKTHAVNRLMIEYLYPDLLSEPINPKDNFRMIKYYINRLHKNPVGSIKKGKAKIMRYFINR